MDKKTCANCGKSVAVEKNTCPACGHHHFVDQEPEATVSEIVWKIVIIAIIILIIGVAFWIVG